MMNKLIFKIKMSSLKKYNLIVFLLLQSFYIFSQCPLKLNGTLITGGNVFQEFQISSDGNTVVYRGDQEIF